MKSPKSFDIKSPKVFDFNSPKFDVIKCSTERFDFSVDCSPKTEYHYKRLSQLNGHHAIVNAAANQLEKSTRSIGTSPKKMIQLLSPIKLSDMTVNRSVLEKSNSLGESKPQKVLRNTRSLSPRPPIRHQHSIMVQDENDVVSVKLSPHEICTDEIFNFHKSNIKKIEIGNLKAEDRYKNNRSTSCLVYVPSNPWTRLIDEDMNAPKRKMSEAKSMSKPNLLNENLNDDDPWVWRSPDTLKKNIKKNNVKIRQTKSLSSKQHTIISSDDIILKKERPKLQGTKAPMPITSKSSSTSPSSAIEILSDIERTKSKSHNIHKSNCNSPKKHVSPNLSFKLSDPYDIDTKTSVVTGLSSNEGHMRASLNVINTNLLQPRHSFSTISPMKNDDELQLNIRRLSEQMKYPTYFNSISPPSLSTVLTSSAPTSLSNPTITTTSNKINSTSLQGNKIYMKKIKIDGGIDMGSAPKIPPDQQQTQSPGELSEPLLETRC